MRNAKVKWIKKFTECTKRGHLGRDYKSIDRSSSIEKKDAHLTCYRSYSSSRLDALQVTWHQANSWTKIPLLKPLLKKNKNFCFFES